MLVELLHATPLEVSDKAIGKCWDKCSVDGINLKRIHRVGNKNKHASTLEHVSYTFDIDGISRALLQELARHRIASLSVKSSRYTLGELKKEEPFNTSILDNYCGIYDLATYARADNYVVFTGIDFVDAAIISNLETLRQCVSAGISNDTAKYCMPEAYKTSLVWTINMRSLQNFIALRSNKAALWEIRDLAVAVYSQLPEDHKFMFVESLDKEFIGNWEKELLEDLSTW